MAIGMELLIWLMIGLLCGTILLDVISTLKRIDRPDSETNPFAHKIMEPLGMKPAILLIFLIALGIISLAGLLALRGGLFMQITLIIARIFISILQAADGQLPGLHPYKNPSSINVF